MTFEILVRPVAPVPVLNTDGTPVEPPSQNDHAVAEWQGGPGNLIKRKDVYIHYPSPFLQNVHTGGSAVGGTSGWGWSGNGVAAPNDGSGDGGGGGIDSPESYGDTFGDDSNKPDDNTPIYSFRERDRKEKTVRISNPTNPQNYVDIAIITAISFDGPGGVYTYSFNDK